MVDSIALSCNRGTQQVRQHVPIRNQLMFQQKNVRHSKSSGRSKQGVQVYIMVVDSQRAPCQGQV